MREVARVVREGLNLPEMHWCGQIREAVTTSGLELEYNDDLTLRDAKVPWYYAYEGNIWKTQAREDLLRIWKMSPSGMFAVLTAVRAMELLQLFPKGTYEVVKHFTHVLTVYVEGGKRKLFTPQYLVIARKPHN